MDVSEAPTAIAMMRIKFCDPDPLATFSGGRSETASDVSVTRQAGATYFHLGATGQLTNPDQRIADDVRAFTITTLSFVIMIFNSGLTILAFSGVLWSISPLLFAVAVGYAACGSFLTIALGRHLIKLNYDQLDKEANFRSSLLHVRERAESIMVARSEKQQSARLLERLDEAIGNFRQITAINRNIGFFTTGYNWLIQIIPALIVAPIFFRGGVEFGVITQSAAAFAMLCECIFIDCDAIPVDFKLRRSGRQACHPH